MQHSIIHIPVCHIHVDSTKSYYFHIINNNNIHIYASKKLNTIRTKTKNDAKQRIKDRINEKMEIQIKHFKNKNKKRNEKGINNFHTTDQRKYNNLQHHVFNQKSINTNPQHFNKTKIEELDNFKNSSDYEAMWEIAIDKWTRNWNLYRERLTDSILEKFGMNNKGQKRQTKIDFVELTGQNINGSATGPQDIFIEITQKK